jgi:hypothetical protein
MREIKYRGKVDGKWWHVTPDRFIRWKHFWTEVDRETVGECIGRLDHHDKEIYEGDVIEYIDNTSQGLVKSIVTIMDIRYLPDFTCSKWEEIIGNIHDSPELLKVNEPA